MSDDAEQALAAVWAEMAALWPALWPKQYGEVGGESYQAWARTLAGLGPNQISRGVEAVRRGGYKYPPAAPEFRRLCAPNARDLGLPTSEEAFAAAQRREWRTPVVWYAVQRYRERGGGDQYDLRARIEPDSTWHRVYAELLREADDGVEFPPPGERGQQLPSQPEHVQPGTDPQQAREAFFGYGRRARKHAPDYSSEEGSSDG